MLKSRLEEDMRAAMRLKEAGKARLSVLRMALAAIKNLEIDKKRPLEDAEVLDVLAREVKSRRDVLPDYERSGRPDLVQKLQDEIALLQEYLPQQATDEEIMALVQARIAAVGAQGPRDLGKVMGPLMQELRGKADGSRVQELVKRALGAG
ncbi:MAG: GatB/YqeY domain-containing protein [Thermaerobacter sp.]|nr:GatB/YqeY domain-containing protein [Thermaerobacter sp.]